jgi:hypothetical protein
LQEVRTVAQIYRRDFFFSLASTEEVQTKSEQLENQTTRYSGLRLNGTAKMLEFGHMENIEKCKTAGERERGVVAQHHI